MAHLIKDQNTLENKYLSIDPSSAFGLLRMTVGGYMAFGEQAPPATRKKPEDAARHQCGYANISFTLDR